MRSMYVRLWLDHALVMVEKNEVRMSAGAERPRTRHQNGPQGPPDRVNCPLRPKTFPLTPDRKEKEKEKEKEKQTQNARPQ